MLPTAQLYDNVKMQTLPAGFRLWNPLRSSYAPSGLRPSRGIWTPAGVSKPESLGQGQHFLPKSSSVTRVPWVQPIEIVSHMSHGSLWVTWVKSHRLGLLWTNQRRKKERKKNLPVLDLSASPQVKMLLRLIANFLRGKWRNRTVNTRIPRFQIDIDTTSIWGFP